MNPYRLYGFKLTGSCAIEAALAEAGIAYEFIPINTKAGESRTTAYAAVNPRQQVPALQLPDGTIVTEGPAILHHIADAYPQSRLAPPPGTSARGTLDRWLAFFHANVYEGELRQLFPQRYADDPGAAPAVKRAADAYVERHFRIFENEISQVPYFFGQQFTILDIYVWMLAQWMDGAWLESRCPKIARLSREVAARPKVAPVHAHHFGG
jgi:glutathione S-transferase